MSWSLKIHPQKLNSASLNLHQPKMILISPQHPADIMCFTKKNTNYCSILDSGIVKTPVSQKKKATIEIQKYSPTFVSSSSEFKRRSNSDLDSCHSSEVSFCLNQVKIFWLHSEAFKKWFFCHFGFCGPLGSEKYSKIFFW